MAPEEKEIVALSSKQVLELEQIMLDSDNDAALKFLDENVYRPIKARKAAHCAPPNPGATR